jgi:hypothetical protein
MGRSCNTHETEEKIEDSGKKTEVDRQPGRSRGR